VEIAAVDSVLFVDCAANSVPGRVTLFPVHAHANGNGHTTHQMDAPGLLALSRTLYGSLPAHAMLLAVGAGSTELGEKFSARVEASLPRARGILEKAVLRFLAN
jgi:hydrogenase maturation protease